MLFCKLIWQNTDAPPGKMSKCTKCLAFDHNLPFFCLCNFTSCVSCFWTLKSTEYFHFSQICKLQNPKQQLISEMANLLKIMHPKYLSFEKKKSQNQSCWSYRTQPHANHKKLLGVHFLRCTSEYLRQEIVGGFQEMIVQEVITVTLLNIFWGERLPAQAGHLLLQAPPA